MPNPGRGVPRAMGLTMLIGTVTAIPFAIALLFSTNDLHAVQTSPVPIATMYFQAAGTKTGGTAITIWFLLIWLSTSVSGILTTSRLVWAFSRDNGLPYSHIFAKVHPKFEAPINSTIATGAFLIVYGAIYVASSNAFNSLISLAILGLNVTYVVPQFLAFWNGRDRVLPDRHLNLGPWFGPFCNVVSTVWVAFVAVLFCFPTFLPVEIGAMNWLSVVSVGVGVFILAVWWGGKRKTFTGPKAIVEGIEGIHHHQSTPASITKSDD